MIEVLRRNWWALIVRGIIAIIFGILAIILPGLTLRVLVLLFGAYALVDGIFMLITAFQGAMEHRLLLLIEGIVSIIAGILTLVWPGLTALVLLYFIAFWAIVTGILEVLAAIRLRREIANEWALGIAGVVSVLFGIIAIVHPLSGALAIIWVIGIYAILFGILLIVLGFRLRGGTESTSGAMRGAT
jgi:uncharacterized membrane protein HdeD (DUF308 family)